MRFYELKINAPDCEFVLDEKHSFGLGIFFKIQSTMQADNVIPTQIEIINAPLTLFTKTETLHGKTLALRAGIKESPITKKQKLQVSSVVEPLFVGKISNVFSTWSGTETRISIQLNSPNLTKNNVTFALNRGDVVAQKVAEFLTNNLKDSGCNFKVDNSALNVLFENSSSINFRLASYHKGYLNIIKEVCNFMRSYDLYLLNKGNEYIIYKRGADEKITTLSGSSVVSVTPDMLLTQPVYADVARISLELSLNSAIKLGTKIRLTNDVQTMSSSLLGDSAGLILKSITDAAILKQGSFNVVECYHNGDSRNPNARAWATNVLCVPCS